MRDPKASDDPPGSLSNRDAIDLPDDASLSDSDPEDSTEAISGKVEDLPSSSDEADDTPVQNVPQEAPTFKLSGGSLGFSYRSRNIFDQLDSAVKLSSDQLAEDNVLDGTFARPAPPSPPPAAHVKRGEPDRTKKASSAKNVPDYLLHPERWTCYNLDDVPETSDIKNAQVAHQFIQELQNRRRPPEATAGPFSQAFNQDHSSSSEHKIVFTKPSQASKDEGQSPQKVEKYKVKEVGLIHLDEGQEEDEEEREIIPVQHNRPSEDVKKRKRLHEKNSDEEDGKAKNVAFNTGKKVNRKNYRKSTEEEEED